MIAKKANKEVKINEDDKERYRAKGYDILGNGGEVIEYAVGGKGSLEAELEELKRVNFKLTKELSEMSG